MKLLSYKLKDAKDIESVIEDYKSKNTEYSAVLVSVSAIARPDEELSFLSANISSKLDKATVIGEIAYSPILPADTDDISYCIDFLTFNDTTFQLYTFDFNEISQNKALQIFLNQCEKHTALTGIEILGTLSNFDSFDFIKKLKALPEHVAIFGGGAMGLNENIQTRVFCRGKILTHGLLAVCFISDTLEIEIRRSMGWQSIGQDMLVTKTDKYNVVNQLDGKSAIGIYEKYLGISRSANLASEILEFPIIVRRHGHDIPRVATNYTKSGALEFGGDVRLNDKVKLSFGDPGTIFRETEKSCRDLVDFDAEAILLFSCISRRFFMRKNAIVELEAYKTVAPVEVHYSHGEICRIGNHIEVLNICSVAVGFRERIREIRDKKNLRFVHSDFTEHMSVVERMARFIAVITKEQTAMTRKLKEANAELEAANSKLAELAQKDSLTHLFNRTQTEQILKNAITEAQKGRRLLTVMMVDIDEFKFLNEKYGHKTGDDVLVNVAKIISSDIGSSDTAGRWGGEEFLIVMPDSFKEEGLNLAEGMQRKIEEISINGEKIKVTASFGIVQFKLSEDYQNCFKRLEEALKESKQKGKNIITAAD